MLPTHIYIPQTEAFLNTSHAIRRRNATNQRKIYIIKDLKGELHMGIMRIFVCLPYSLAQYELCAFYFHSSLLFVECELFIKTNKLKPPKKLCANRKIRSRERFFWRNFAKMRAMHECEQKLEQWWNRKPTQETTLQQSNTLAYHDDCTTTQHSFRQSVSQHIIKKHIVNWKERDLRRTQMR